MKTVRLNKETEIPVLGLGTWKLNGEECVEAVAEAISIGYRHIDTADAYENHAEVREGIRKSGIGREDLFLTTKLHFDDGYKEETVRKSGERLLKELDTDYVDLLLIHWPDRSTSFEETLHAMDELKKAGKARALGVSNFTIHHLEDALKAGVEITDNQVEIHPAFTQKELRDFCALKKIAVTAYSPLGRKHVLELPLLHELADKYEKTPAQIALNWIVSRGMITIPKSANPQRIKENFDSLSFSIEEPDLVRIDEIPQEERIVAPAYSDFDY